MAALVIHLGATLALVGLIWTVQVVHYPLMRGVGREGWIAYHAEHARRITRVVAPLMLVELATAVWLAVLPPAAIADWMAWLGLSLVGVVWAATAFVAVPLHARLGVGFDERVHRRLVATNWIRTVAWSLRGVLVLAWITQLAA